MYVLMDLEWVTNKQYHISPTQIAAMRVDDSWNELDRFFTRIRPRDTSFHRWGEVAYAGGNPSDFLYARGIFQVLTDLLDWLHDDDILCFWTKDSINMLKSVCHLVLQQKFSQRMIDLSQYIFPYLKAQKKKCGNAYQLAAGYGCPVPGPKHHSERDVEAVRAALHGIQYPADLLLLPPPAPTPAKAEEPAKGEQAPVQPSPNRPYQYDHNHELFHKRDCSEIPDDAVLSGHPNLKYLFRKNLKPCPVCMAQEYREALRERNRDTIQRSEYNYIYLDNSEVFHRQSCKAILNTTGIIRGSIYYHTCRSMGLRPCKLCNPTENSRPASKKKPKVKKAQVEPQRSLKQEQQRALIRFERAREERFSRKNTDFKSDTERDDFYTLTQTRYAFWAGAGYATFHRRECRKLQGLSNIRGFSRYKEAIRSGYTPCKCCKPNPKQDIVCPVPMNSRKRDDESVLDLEALCKEHDYPYLNEGDFFIFSTPVGKWKVRVGLKPYVVDHINLVSTPGNEFNYHRQPRLFLSLLDTFDYIFHHDTELETRLNNRKSTQAEHICNE